MAKELYTNTELIDTLILDCNEAVKAVASGQMIQWCKLMYEMVIKLSNLKKGIQNDLANREQTITALTQQLRAVGVDIQTIDISEITQEKEGATDGE